MARPQTEIAVVVPLYNHERYVTAALQSLVGQTAAAAEIVVIDDGSDDNGFARAEECLRDVPDCRLLRQANAGAHAAINRAVAMTTAPYIAVLNSDDLFVPDKLAWCQEIIAALPGVSLIAGRVGLIGARGERLTRGPSAEWLARAEAFAERTGLEQLALLHENFIATTSNMVFSRTLWQYVGGFSALRYCHDLDFLMRAFDHGRVARDKARLHVLYRVHAGNTIEEDRAKLRTELAAVIAASLCQSGDRLLPPGGPAFAACIDMLRANRLAELVAYLCAMFPRFADRDDFLEFATAGPGSGDFTAFLRQPR